MNCELCREEFAVYDGPDDYDYPTLCPRCRAEFMPRRQAEMPEEERLRHAEQRAEEREELTELARARA